MEKYNAKVQLVYDITYSLWSNFENLYSYVLFVWFKRRKLQNQKMSIEEGARRILFLARLHGLHLIIKNSEGKYVVSLWGCFLITIHTIIFMLSSIIFIYRLLFTRMDFQVMIFLCPVVISIHYIISSNITILINRKRIAKHMEQMNKIKVYFPDAGYNHFLYIFLTTGCIFTSLMYSIVINVENNIFYIIFIILATYVPIVVDVYISSFLYVLAMGYEEFCCSIKRTNNWDDDQIHQVFTHWLFLQDLANSQNKVIF